MSRRYQMDIRATGARTREDAEDILDVFQDLWCLESESVVKLSSGWQAYGVGESYLCGGESEGEFANRVIFEVWKKLGYFIQIDVLATCLEYLPFEAYSGDEHLYESWSEAEYEAKAQDDTFGT